MKYKVGDRVRIKEDISECRFRNHEGKMDGWQGKVMTVTKYNFDPSGCYYSMQEDNGRWGWHSNMIAGFVDRELTNTEVLKLAIDTYGQDEQLRMCQEEMNELGVALSKYHRNPCEDTRADVQEEIADVCIIMQQAKLIFGEKEVNEIMHEKIKRLAQRLKDEREVEVVYGKHDINGSIFTWVNPDKHEIRVGGIAKADTRHGEKPIIVENTNIAKYKHVKHHKKITGGVE